MLCNLAPIIFSNLVSLSLLESLVVAILFLMYVEDMESGVSPDGARCPIALVLWHDRDKQQILLGSI